jgi:hypothetical protein
MRLRRPSSLTDRALEVGSAVKHYRCDAHLCQRGVREAGGSFTHCSLSLPFASCRNSRKLTVRIQVAILDVILGVVIPRRRPEGRTRKRSGFLCFYKLCATNSDYETAFHRSAGTDRLAGFPIAVVLPAAFLVWAGPGPRSPAPTLNPQR